MWILAVISLLSTWAVAVKYLQLLEDDAEAKKFMLGIDELLNLATSVALLRLRLDPQGRDLSDQQSNSEVVRELVETNSTGQDLANAPPRTLIETTIALIDRAVAQCRTTTRAK